MNDDRKPATLIDRHIGFRAKTRRELLSADIGLISRMIGITAEHLTEIENGMRSVDASILLRLTRVLEVPISWFYDGLGQLEVVALADPQHQLQTLGQVSQEMSRSESLAMLTMYYDGLDDPQRELLIEIARTLHAGRTRAKSA